MEESPTAARSRTITLRFPVELFNRLEAAAEADRRSISSMASILIEDGLSVRSTSHAS